MKHFFEDLPGWTFEIEEVSANVFELVGTDGSGRRVEMRGGDEEALLEDGISTVKSMLIRGSPAR